MIEVSRSGGVTRIRMWTLRTLEAGYDVSAYVIRGILVDTGFRHVRRELEGALGGLGVRGVVVTHWHEDHAGNAAALAARMPAWMPALTEATLRARPPIKPYRHVVWGRPEALAAQVQPQATAPLELVHTPGHCDDHHVAYDAETGTVFSADLWLGVRVKVMGAGENPYQTIASLGRVMELHPERMFDAHRGLVEKPVESLRAKRDWLEDTVGEIERRLAGGDSERAVLREVLGGEEPFALVTGGEYSRRNFVRAVMHGPRGPRA